MTTLLTLAGAVHAADAPPTAVPAPVPPPSRTSSPHQVVELRQYRIVPGQRDAMIDLFERVFVDSQEALGMRLVGTFRDVDDPDRFTWIRAFDDLASRPGRLEAFYYGPVWKAHRDEANPKLDDNDNVLLLRPAWPASGFAPARGRRPSIDDRATPPSGLVVATIHYLWKDPDEGFTALFRDRLAPAYAAAGLPVVGAYVAEAEPNNFPKLIVRQGEKVFVWFTRVDDEAAYRHARDALSADPTWRDTLAPELVRAEERATQVLRLAPTRRSLLR